MMDINDYIHKLKENNYPAYFKPQIIKFFDNIGEYFMIGVFMHNHLDTKDAFGVYTYIEQGQPLIFIDVYTPEERSRREHECDMYSTILSIDDDDPIDEINEICNSLMEYSYENISYWRKNNEKDGRYYKVT